MEREAFLRNISRRLGRDRIEPPAARPQFVPESYREAPLGNDSASLVSRFERELAALGASMTLARDLDEVSDALRSLLANLAPKTIITWDRSEFDGWNIPWLWESHGAIPWVAAPGGTDAGPLGETALTADVGVTTVDYAIANAGTLLLSTTARRPRTVSLLPTTHISLVHEAQIVPRLGIAFDSLNPFLLAAPPSSLHLISGPSRSADIENDLSIGVHGPAALHVIVLSVDTVD